MPGSASTTSHRSESLITRLRSASSQNNETKLKVLRELKNEIIGNRTKKLSYIKLGAVPYVVSILSNCDCVNDCLIVVQCAAILGSFACGVDLGVSAVLEAAAFEHLIALLNRHNVKG
nr:armadillo repeat-containing protein 8 [Tanacetum cinerariifolium]